MAHQIIIGLMTEGPTDQRFLKNIIERTFQEIAFDCKKAVEIVDVIAITKSKGKFVEQVLVAAKEAIENGATIICVQADADGKSLDSTYQYKISPAITALDTQDSNFYCKNLVPIVPIQEIEAWMLADTVLLRKEIGATKQSDTDLGIHRKAESVANPKEVIENAIRVVGKKGLSISELYSSIGQSIELRELEKLRSYQDFQENVRKAFRDLGLLV